MKSTEDGDPETRNIMRPQVTLLRKHETVLANMAQAGRGFVSAAKLPGCL